MEKLYTLGKAHNFINSLILSLCFMPEILLWNVVYKGDFLDIIKKTLPLVKKKNVTIYYVCNWENLAKELKKELEKIGVSVQLVDFLGCERYRVENDLVVCDGKFHLNCFEGEFVWINPIQNEVKEIERKFEVDKRLPYAMTKKYFGIIISTKSGQFHVNFAKKIKERLRRLGKKVYMFVGNEIKNLENFPFIEVWINTACPRLKDDFKNLLFFNVKEFLQYLKRSSTE